MTGDPEVSIAIVTYNATDFVRKCLESIRRHTRPAHEVIVVDNASAPATREYLASVDWIKLTLNSENRLWCPALNQALSRADPRSRYFMLLNPDVEILDPSWLERLEAILESDPKVGITGTQHNYRPLGPTYGAIDGHCFMFKRELYEDPAIGPLDERYPWNGSPYVFTARAWSKGFTYKVHPPRPRLLIHHRARSRAEADRPMPNVRISPSEILKEAGLSPRREGRLAGALRRRLIRWGRPPS